MMNFLPRIKGSSPFLVSLITIMASLLLQSCQTEDSPIGSNLRPDNGIINSEQKLIDNIFAVTKEEGAVGTDSLSTYYLGCISNNIFGETSIDLAFDFSLAETGYPFDSLKTLDSVVLVVPYSTASFIGEFNPGSINVSLYELDEAFIDGQAYFSNSEISHLANNLGAFQGVVNTKDSVTLGPIDSTYKLRPHFRVKLNEDFETQVLNFPRESFTSNDELKKALKGLKLVAEPTANGIIAPIRIIQAELVFFYNGNQSYKLNINQESKKANLVRKNSHPLAIQNQLNNQNQPFEETYVQGMGQLMTHIKFNEMYDLVENNKAIVIHEATLEIPVSQTMIDRGFQNSSLLAAYQVDSLDGSRNIIPDFADFIVQRSINQPSSFDGSFHEDKGAYIIRINRYVQRALRNYYETGTKDTSGLYLSIESVFDGSPSYDVIFTPPHQIAINARKIKLNIYHTKLNN